MYFINDTAWRQTGLSSRSLSQLITLLLTTLTGPESNPAACLFSAVGGGDEVEDSQAERGRGQPLCFPLTVSHICSCGAHARLCSFARVRCQFCFARGRFQAPARVVMCQAGCRRAATVNVFPPPPAVNTLQPLVAYRGCFFFLSASSQAPSSSTLLRPQWLILTQAAVVSNQHSQPRT